MDNGIDETLYAEEEARGNMSVLKGEPARFMENGQGVLATRTVETGAGAWMSTA